MGQPIKVCWTISCKCRCSAPRAQFPSCLFCSCGVRSSLRAQGTGRHALPCCAWHRCSNTPRAGASPCWWSTHPMSPFPRGRWALSSVLKTLGTRTHEAAVDSSLAQIRTRAFKTLRLPGTFLEPRLKTRDSSSHIKGGLLSW